MIEALEALSPDVPVLFVGPPGVGKTARVHAWAEARGHEVIVEHPVIAQSVDYRGLPVPCGDYARWLPLGALRRVTEPSERPRLLFFDDVGQAPQSVQAALMQIVLARRIGDAELAPDVLIVLASNRAEDRSGARPLLAALDNRVLRYEVQADPQAWAQWLVAQADCDPMVAGYVRFRPDCFASAVPDVPGPFCTPRSLHLAAKLIARGHAGLIAGVVGAGTAADLRAWLAAASKFPPIADMLAQPATITDAMRADPGIMHAVVVMAAREAGADPAGVARLAEHVGKAWGVSLISTAVAAHPGFRATPAFKAWAKANKGLL